MVMATRKQPEDPHWCQRCFKLPAPKRHKQRPGGDGSSEQPHYTATSRAWSASDSQLLAVKFKPTSVDLSSGRGCKVVKDLPWVCLSHPHCRRMRGSCFLSPYCEPSHVTPTRSSRGSRRECLRNKETTLGGRVVSRDSGEGREPEIRTKRILPASTHAARQPTIYVPSYVPPLMS